MVKPWYAMVGLFCLGAVGCAGADDDDSATDDDDSAAADDDDDDTGDDAGAYSVQSGTIEACSGEIAYTTYNYSGTAEATLFIVNGRAEYTDLYAHWLNYLYSRPWNVVLWDHYGQGRSAGVRAHADDFDLQHVCDMGQVIDQLSDPALPRIVASHSTGGLITTRYIQQNPGVFEAVVLGSPLLGMAAPAGVAVADACGLARAAVISGIGELPFDDYGPLPPCSRNEFTHDCEMYALFTGGPLDYIGAPTWGFGAATCDAGDRIFANIAQITEPILLFQAGLDSVINLPAQDEFCAAVNATSASSCDLVRFPEDYHAIFSELDRAVAFRLAYDFLEASLASE